MPGLGIVVPLLIFLMMVVLVATLIWRVTLVAGELRQETQFRHSAADIVRRADTSLTELATLVDAVRHGTSGPDAVQLNLLAAAEAIRMYADEGESVACGPLQMPLRTGLIEDLARAARAIDLIDHGCTLLADGRFDHHGEGETSVKRGYVNLLHAREALRARADDIARPAVAGPESGLSWRRRAH